LQICFAIARTDPRYACFLIASFVAPKVSDRANRCCVPSISYLGRTEPYRRTLRNRKWRYACPYLEVSAAPPLSFPNISEMPPPVVWPHATSDWEILCFAPQTANGGDLGSDLRPPCPPEIHADPHAYPAFHPACCQLKFDADVPFFFSLFQLRALPRASLIGVGFFLLLFTRAGIKRDEETGGK